MRRMRPNGLRVRATRMADHVPGADRRSFADSQGSGVFRECHLSLIEAVEAEGLGGGGGPAGLRDVQVAGVFEGCGNGGADGG